MKILNRQKQFLSLLDPALARKFLALGAMPVAAGIVGNMDMPAFVTFVHVSAQVGGAAVFDGGQRF